jgi:hypothetical protein
MQYTWACPMREEEIYMTFQKSTQPPAPVIPDRDASTAELLLDRSVFELEEVQYAAFMNELDRSGRDNPGLRKLLAAKAPWEAG